MMSPMQKQMPKKHRQQMPPALGPAPIESVESGRSGLSHWIRWNGVINLWAKRPQLIIITAKKMPEGQNTAATSAAQQQPQQHGSNCNTCCNQHGKHVCALDYDSSNKLVNNSSPSSRTLNSYFWYSPSCVCINKLFSQVRAFCLLDVDRGLQRKWEIERCTGKKVLPRNISL